MTPQVKKLIIITIAWTLVSIYEYCYTYVVLLSTDYAGDFYQLDLGSFITIGILPGILAGLIGGSLLLVLWSKWLREVKYGYALLSIFITYSILFLFIYGAASVFYGFYRSNTGGQVELDQVIRSYFWNINGLMIYITWMIVVILTLIFMLVSDKYGPGVFVSMLKGEYFQPRRQERVIMFLDLNSSTAIAEMLGEHTYFSFLKDTIKFITPVILKYQGEIYQYVGDEIVISWKIDSKRQNSINCFLCFLEIQRKLKEVKEYYNGRYGLQPIFKAGIHYGIVMIGEIGVVKREIAHSGDTMNTAARIRSKCTEFKVNILFSESLLKFLKTSPDQFSINKLGSLTLRGKKNPLKLFTLSDASTERGYDHRSQPIFKMP